jgi:glutamate-1-semialdehyde 2,1-aminomutase
VDQRCDSPFTAQLAAARDRYRAARPHSAALAERARSVLPGGSTRSVLDMSPFAFRVAEAHGATLTDVDGHELIDLLGDYSAGLLGHDPAPVAAAVIDRLGHGWGLGATHTDEIRLAELICGRFPTIDQVRFTNSGTEANLMAIQVARHLTGRDEVMVFAGAYHGGLLYFGRGGEALRAPFMFHEAAYNDIDSVDAILDAHGQRIAAVLVEPMMGAGGCLPAADGFLAGLRDLCDRHGVMLIFDEVMTSRMSSGGAQDRLGIHPDLTTLGKYLAGGMTFGAFGGSADTMAVFDPARGGTLSHGGTFNNNAVSMAAGVATLSEILTPTVLDAHFERGETMRERWSQIAAAAPLPLTITGWGSMFAIHATDGPVRSPADTGRSDPVLTELVFHELLHRGVYLAPRGFAALSLAIGGDEIERATAAFADALDDIASAAA